MPASRWSDLERPPLDVRALNHALTRDGQWREIRIVEETGSTSADVAELARGGEPAGLVLVAEHQTAGRGRLARTWSAPPRSALTFSMLLRPDGVAAARWRHLPLLVGVGVVRALLRVAEIDASLKWPNDVMVGDRKLGGILAERVESEAGPAAVVGVGLNISLRAAELPVPTAISLALAGASRVDRDTVLRAVLRGIASEYEEWAATGGAAHVFLPAYRDLCATIGRRVRVELPGGTAIEGLAGGVDDDGSLVVETASGARAVSAGDVVHVR